MKLRILAALLFSITALGLVRADSVFVKGREKPIVGSITNEDAKGVSVAPAKLKKSEEFVPASEVLDIHYEDIKPVDLVIGAAAPYKLAKDAEKEWHDATDPAKRKAAAQRAITNYSEMLSRMQPHKYGKRMFEYKVAIIMLRQAQTDQTSTDKAIARLQAFKNAYPKSWQISQVVPMIAEAQMDAKDYKGAAETFQEMAAFEGLPAETRINAELEVVRVYLRIPDVATAQKKLDVLTTKSAGNPQFASRVKMTRAELLVSQKNMKDALPILQQVVKENNDKQIKALAHNTLGECYFKDNRLNEAMWEFLWVDAVFNQDRHQHAKALYYLWKTFEQLSIADRAQECREMLLNDKTFAGTEYQTRAAKEAK